MLRPELWPCASAHVGNISMACFITGSPPHHFLFSTINNIGNKYRPFTEGVQAGQDFGVVVVVQTDTTHQELLVYLADHWACAAGLKLRHGDRHPQRGPRARTHLNLK